MWGVGVGVGVVPRELESATGSTYLTGCLAPCRKFSTAGAEEVP